ncbi:glycerol kinase GlpK [Sulfidibacter corallicola]|uniref:Glycerol kinase n=1 Tax=Sulfidibacter corallicola TaxID=2818388 RepID=A0A8A4TX13_SULCO|nr:glycerol kinase GlpK [Sulfidibacter corallicola]QTD53664.1 glycerol kinase GlpK [Sulfidibacter corallicola]
MSDSFILAIDQGTTSSRAILFDKQGHPVGMAQEEFPQHYPADGWVEHDPNDIWSTTERVCRAVLADRGIDAGQVAAIGVTNQRETTLIWNRRTGEPLHAAIVWQDRRTAELCTKLKQEGHETWLRQKTGLLLDPYFSATKIKWILDQVPGARSLAAAGDLAFGTVDTYLLWRLTERRVHATDATNASRTLLFNIHTQQWDPDLLDLFQIPAEIMPSVLDCSADFGSTRLFGGDIPILGIAGDQQAATIGQACFEPGMVKSTYGTGCFVVQNTGDTAIQSQHRLLSTIAYRIDGRTTYGLEGSIFVAGAAIQWLRDEMGLIDTSSESEKIAAALSGNHGVYLVPAFTGLGAPHWNPDARGAIVGLTRNASAAHVVRATLEAVCYQTRDLMSAMAGDGTEAATLRVDGGMVGNDWLCQFLADILGLPVQRPVVAETTALGVAYLAGLKLGWYGSLEEIGRLWERQASFKPAMDEPKRTRLYEGWKKALARVQ